MISCLNGVRGWPRRLGSWPVKNYQSEAKLSGLIDKCGARSAKGCLLDRLARPQQDTEERRLEIPTQTLVVIKSTRTFSVAGYFSFPTLLGGCVYLHLNRSKSPNDNNSGDYQETHGNRQGAGHGKVRRANVYLF